MFLLEIYLGVGLLDYMVTTFTCGRVSRECQDLPPGDLLSHQELLWKLCQTDPKVTPSYSCLLVLTFFVMSSL